MSALVETQALEMNSVPRINIVASVAREVDVYVSCATNLR